MSRDEGPDHSIPAGRRAILRETWATWLGRCHRGERNPTPIQYPTLCQVSSRATSVTKHLRCGRSHAGLFTRTVPNGKALLYTKSWLGAHLGTCSFIKHLLHAGPMLHFELLAYGARVIYGARCWALLHKLSHFFYAHHPISWKEKRNVYSVPANSQSPHTSH